MANSDAARVSKRLAYADPPYPGRAHLYKDHPDYAGEVDHVELVGSLTAYDGWALSTDSPSLHFVLSLCPADVRIAAWVRPNSVPYNPDGLGAVRTWEPVIYKPARLPRNDPARVRDVLTLAAPNGHQYKGLPGAKPRGFGAWVFSLIGARPGDAFVDLFPGSGGVGEEWDVWSAQPSLFAAALGGSGSYQHAQNEVKKHPKLTGEAAA